jgi:hypothetical protein
MENRSLSFLKIIIFIVISLDFSHSKNSFIKFHCTGALFKAHQLINEAINQLIEEPKQGDPTHNYDP